MNPIIRYVEEVEWSKDAPFPAKMLFSKQDARTASVRLITLDKSKGIEPHAHVECDQLEYCLKGEALMFIEGLGEKEIRGGSFTYIPKGVRHPPLNVAGSLEILTVFVPPLF